MPIEISLLQKQFKTISIASNAMVLYGAHYFLLLLYHNPYLHKMYDRANHNWEVVQDSLTDLFNFYSKMTTSNTMDD